MRVGLVIYGLLDTRSGGYLYDHKLVEGLRAAGDQVQIFSLPWRSYAGHLGQNFSTSFARRLAGAQLDILLQDELNHPSLFWLNRRIRPLVGYPLLSIVHHLRISEQHPAVWMPFYRWIERAYLNTVDGFVFNSQTTRRAVEALLGRQVAGIVATPAGDRFASRLSVQDICARAAAAGSLSILFVGNLIARKGLDTLLRALAQLDSPHWQLHIAGRQDVDRKYSAEMRCLVGEMGLAERVVFLGGVSDRELESEMRLAHVLVVPSQYEGFGIVYLEGMGFGLPAIGTNAGGAGEIIQPGINGWLIDPGDAGALARVLERFLLDRQELQRMSLAAWRRFADFPTWDAGMAALRGSLAGLCGSAPVDLAE